MGIHDTHLYASIVEGRELCEIAVYIDKVPNLNWQCRARPTVLHAAVMHNNVAATALLLQRGADMMITPIKRCATTGFECALIMAFKRDESYEDIKLLLLRHLATYNREHLDRAAVKNIARLDQYAMMCGSARVFWEAQGLRVKMLPVQSSGFNPLMSTIIQVGRFEEQVVQCEKIFTRVLAILDGEPTMLWHHYRFTKSNSPTFESFAGSTALGMLLFHVMPDRHKRCAEYADYVEGKVRGEARLAQYMPLTGPQAEGLIEFEIQRSAEQLAHNERNLAVMNYLTTELAPRLFAKMLPPMRVALGMATHARLGKQCGCGIGMLNGDIMNAIFNRLVGDIVTSPAEYRHMLF